MLFFFPLVLANDSLELADTKATAVLEPMISLVTGDGEVILLGAGGLAGLLIGGAGFDIMGAEIEISLGISVTSPSFLGGTSESSKLAVLFLRNVIRFRNVPDLSFLIA
jgi:hypothetical protein